MEAKRKPRKTYMLDASVLLHDPNAIYAFEDNLLIIPTLTIETLSDAAAQPGERGANARDALRKIMALFNGEEEVARIVSSDEGKSTFEEEISVQGVDPEFDPESNTSDFMTRFTNAAVTLQDTGGTVALTYSDWDEDILKVASDNSAILITKDSATRLTAIARGIAAEDYLHDRVDDTGRFYSGRSIVYLPSKSVSTLVSNGSVAFPAGTPVYNVDEKTGQEVERDPEYHLTENEFLVVKNSESPNAGGALGRFTHGKIVTLKWDKCRPYDVQPRNVGQRFAIEALMAPAMGDDAAPLVILKGPAGTAKTFLAMACGLEQAHNKAEYRGILATRPASLLDESPGYLPGTEVEKISPLLRPVFDAVDALMPSAEKGKDGSKGSPVDDLLASGVLDIQAMTFMRGRSIPNTYIIIDEAQNCTPTQLLTLVTRVAVGTKIVIMGDPDQIDNPYLDKYSNGLTFVSERMRGSEVCWQLTFTDEECERSRLANEAIHRLTRR